MLTRRAAIILGLGTAAVPGYSKDFWVEKKPDQWSEKEIDKLLNHSPWTKEVTAELNMGGGMGMGGGRGGSGMGSMSADSSAGMGGGEMPTAGGGGGRGGRGGRGGGGLDEMPRAPQINAQIRWESAPAVRSAQKRALPKEMESFYVISLNTQPTPMMMGLLMGGGGRGGPRGEKAEGVPEQSPEERRAAMLARLKTTTELQRKGKDPIHPEKILTGQSEGRLVFLFLFPHGGQPIAVEDKDVTFLCKLGAAQFKTKFSLKDMVMDGKLEL